MHETPADLWESADTWGADSGSTLSGPLTPGLYEVIVFQRPVSCIATQCSVGPLPFLGNPNQLIGCVTSSDQVVVPSVGTVDVAASPLSRLSEEYFHEAGIKCDLPPYPNSGDTGAGFHLYGLPPAT